MAVYDSSALEADNGVATALYHQWLSQQRAAAKQSSYGLCSCVNYVKSLTGFTQVIGLAKHWPVNAAYPQVGGVVVFAAGHTGHVGYITAVGQDSFHITEANFVRCNRSNRDISVSDNSIIGYWTP